MPDDNVVDFASGKPRELGTQPPGGGDDGRANDHGERIAAVETHLQCLATKADLMEAIGKITAAIADQRSTIVITAVGLVVAAAAIGAFIAAAVG